MCETSHTYITFRKYIYGPETNICLTKIMANSNNYTFVNILTTNIYTTSSVYYLNKMQIHQTTHAGKINTFVLCMLPLKRVAKYSLIAAIVGVKC